MLIVSGNEKDNTLMKVLISKITKLGKLECRLHRLQEFNNGIEHYGVNKRI